MDDDDATTLPDPSENFEELLMRLAAPHPIYDVGLSFPHQFMSLGFAQRK